MYKLPIWKLVIKILEIHVPLKFLPFHNSKYAIENKITVCILHIRHHKNLYMLPLKKNLH